MSIFRSFVISNLDYCKTVWHFCSLADVNKLERLQERGLRIVYNDDQSDYSTLLYLSNCISLEERRLQCILCEVYKACRGLAPLYISDLFKRKECQYDLCRRDQLIQNRKRTTCYGLKSFTYLGACLWNRLPNELKDLETLTSFKHGLASLKLTDFM